jgi:hypothetical protein
MIRSVPYDSKKRLPDKCVDIMESAGIYAIMKAELNTGGLSVQAERELASSDRT